jgi:RNA polymerase sigma-70 factor (ECF subfamily)
LPNDSPAQRRAITYCIVPEDLADRLHEPLRRHFADDAGVDVIVERRGCERRCEPERRVADTAAAPAQDRRRIRNSAGRRIGERRARSVAVESLGLPRRAAAFAARLAFVERLEPSSQHLEDLDTARLVIRIQSGEQDEFAELYLRYFSKVYSYLRLIVKDAHEAEDATQQVFVQVFERIGSYERRSQPFRAWLFAIARNCGLNSLRRARWVDVTDPGELVREDVEASDGTDLQALKWVSDPELLFLVDRLPLAQRQVLVLRFLLELSTAEIASTLDRSVVDVRALQSRALRFLRARLIALGRGGARSGERARVRLYRRQAPVLRARRWVLWN